jgi:DNA-binding NtrC family response regulator
MTRPTGYRSPEQENAMHGRNNAHVWQRVMVIYRKYKAKLTIVKSGAGSGMGTGNVLQAAQMLRVPRGTLRYKMSKYGL